MRAKMPGRQALPPRNRDAVQHELWRAFM